MLHALTPKPSPSARPRHPRTDHTCVSCGQQFGARPGDHLGAIFCATCLDETDDPVTAEHYWDLGGGD